MKIKFKAYLLERLSDKTACTYLLALDKMPGYLSRHGIHCGDVWGEDFSLADLQNAASFVRKESKLPEGGLLTGYKPKSHWSKGWFAAAVTSLKNYFEDPQQGLGITQMKTDPKLKVLAKDIERDLQKARYRDPRQLALRILASLASKQFLILTGLSGSGKTQIAVALAKWLLPPAKCQDVFRPGAEIQSANKTYYVEKSDSHSVEFWNSKEIEEVIKVTLPREVITEWSDYIQKNDIPQSTSAREIREVVKKTSKFSDQLHSFETHLKAAAFALLGAAPDVMAPSYEVISVGADWTSSDNLLGYPDALRAGGYRKPDNGALNLIIQAKKNPREPYFLILDEMNLSHVERYFSDFLSAMESGAPINLHDDDGASWDGVPAQITIPRNLFVLGTVNVDETTYMFSPKVLDRANVIEFRVSKSEMQKFLDDPAKPDLKSLEGKGTHHAETFMEAAAQRDTELSELKDVSEVLSELFPALEEAAAEFGYRTAHEICRLVHFHKMLSSASWKLDQAMDIAIMQKILPKLHGAKKKLGPVLDTLIAQCLLSKHRAVTPITDELLVEENARYPRSLEKLKRMRKRLRQLGFASFAEA